MTIATEDGLFYSLVFSTAETRIGPWTLEGWQNFDKNVAAIATARQECNSISSNLIETEQGTLSRFEIKYFSADFG